MSKPSILGGAPINGALPAYLTWPVPGPAEKEALLRALNSGIWGTLGPEYQAFSSEYAAYCQAEYALPVLNGTVSLELILRALGIGRGDEVIVPPYTFIASVSAIAMVGAMPVFADIDPDTYTLCPDACERAITDKTRAIIAVHLGGRPFDIDRLTALAKRRGLPLIEDAAHAQGSEWRGRRVGSFGTAGSFSFQASKNITCGEGGAITTNDRALYERLWSLHHNGRAFGETSYDHPHLGTNARLAEWQCAVLRAQMQRADADIERRMENAAFLDRALAQFPFFLPIQSDVRVTRNGLHLYVFRYRKEGLGGLSRAAFLRALSAENVCVPASGYASPIYEMEFLHSEAFKKAVGRTFVAPDPSTLPANEYAAREEGCWMSHSNLLGTRADMERIVEAFGRIAGHADAIRTSLKGEG